MWSACLQMEYPALDEKWDINLGFCQTGSTLHYHSRAMDLRNWLWYKVQLEGLSSWSPVLCVHACLASHSQMQ